MVGSRSPAGPVCRSRDHLSAPVAASRAKTLPPKEPTTTVPSATTGVPVKSPSSERKRQASVSVAACSAEGSSAPPSRELARSFPYTGQSACAGALRASAASAITGTDVLRTPAHILVALYPPRRGAERSSAGARAAATDGRRCATAAAVGALLVFGHFGRYSGYPFKHRKSATWSGSTGREEQMNSARLKKIDLFASLSDEELDRLAKVIGEVSIDEGEELIHAGTPPYQMFAIEEGAVEVRRNGETLATIGEGEVVGERGIVTRGLRNASAIATGPVRAIFLTEDQVRRLRREHPEVEDRLRSILEERGE